MNNNDFLTESQTLAYAGIDRNILTRFCETGYIKTKMLSNGQVLYSKAEIERVFGKRREVLSANVANDSSQYMTQANSNYTEESANASSFNSSATKNTHENQNTASPKRLIKFPESAKASISSMMSDIDSRKENLQKNLDKSEEPKEINKDNEKTLNIDNESTIEQVKNENLSNEDIQNNLEKVQSNLEKMLDSFEKMQSNLEKNQSILDEPQETNDSSEYNDIEALKNENEKLRQEIIKLQSYARLQKKLLEVKEKEISELKQEKDWFKSRIETQEEKNNRDQLLILSETRVIHNLISNNQKKSTFRTALEWFGFSKKDRQGTIDMGDN